ncbi:unnamed protein product, partial [marine sediment metagenome]
MHTKVVNTTGDIEMPETEGTKTIQLKKETYGRLLNEGKMLSFLKVL